MGRPFDTDNLDNNRTTTIRAALFMVIMGTLPFYFLGFALWATAPDPDAPEGDNGETVPLVTNTPLGQGDEPTERATLRPTSTPFPTLPSLQDTPWQFIPPVVQPTIRPTNTSIVIPTSTPFPTFTPLPTNTPIPQPTNTFIPPPTNTEVPADTPPDIPPPPVDNGDGDNSDGGGDGPPINNPPPPPGG